MAAPRTMFEKVWADHEVGPELLYVDLHLVHEVTSAQAFEGLRLAGRTVRRPDRTIATADHNVPTGPGEPDELSRAQLAALEHNCEEFGVRLYPLGHRRQGVVHVIGPELGLTQPGMTIVNMSIEAGARAGMMAPDDTTYAYLEGRPGAPAEYEAAVERWRGYASDEGAAFDREVTVDLAGVVPQVSWGTNPSQVAPITGVVPEPRDETDERALAYMDLRPGMPLRAITVDRVFLGSCTNARIEDLRAAAGVVRGRRVAAGVRAMVVPRSALVKAQAEREGLDAVFRAAGFEWRGAGCSMCLGMNPDILQPGERCASTSNRNFEGRQGRGGRTHLMSPATAAATAIAGRLADVRELADVEELSAGTR